MTEDVLDDAVHHEIDMILACYQSHCNKEQTQVYVRARRKRYPSGSPPTMRRWVSRPSSGRPSRALCSFDCPQKYTDVRVRDSIDTEEDADTLVQ